MGGGGQHREGGKAGGFVGYVEEHRQEGCVCVGWVGRGGIACELLC